MKKTFQIKDLIGPPLDQAVAVALGYVHSIGPWWHDKNDSTRMLDITTFSPSVNSGQGHDIIEESWIGLVRPSLGQTPPIWRALSDFHGDRKIDPMGNVVGMWGATSLIAAMRCKVASVYGTTIELDIPDNAQEA